MEEKEKELKDKKDTINELPIGYIEDNNLNLFLEDTIDLDVIVEKVKENE